MTGVLEGALRAKREQGRKLLAPYVTGGIGDDWTELVRAVAAAGADAIEIGIPFSDPVMDGPTIQAASQRALDRKTTPGSILDELVAVDAGVPLVAMTYYNLVFRAGHERFAQLLARAGVAGAIVPDLPLEESGDWERAAAAAGVETVLLAAPVTPDHRLQEICDRARGFIYAVSRMGITGEQESLAGSAAVIAGRVKKVTDKPVLVGIGVSTPAQAAEVCRAADGAVVGSALMRRFLEGGTVEDVAALVADMRAAIDAV